MKKAYALGLLTVLFWSTSATAFKITLQYLEVLPALFYAILTAVLILGGFLAMMGRLGQAFALGRGAYARAAGLGVLNPFIYYWMAVTAYDLLPAQVVQPINYTWVITLTLLSIPLLGQRLTRVQALACLVSYAGVVVISLQGGEGQGAAINYFGVFLAVSCTLIWALYWIYNVRSAHDPLAGIFLNFLFSLPVAALACGALGSFAVADARGLLGAVWIGAFEFGFAFIAWISALRMGQSTAGVANLIFLTPFLSLVFIHFILGEDIRVHTWAGLGLILSGIALQKISEARS